MVFIQQIRTNDVVDDNGKQVDLNKAFIDAFGWKKDQYEVVILYGDVQVKTIFKRITRADNGYAYYREIGNGYPFKSLLKDNIGLQEFDYFLLSRIDPKDNKFKLAYVKKSENSQMCRILDDMLTSVSGHCVDVLAENVIPKQSNALQKIIYGAPGTGKSHKIDYKLFVDANSQEEVGIKNSHLGNDQIWRITFHPDYDYSQFVGSFKPKVSHKELNSHVKTAINEIANAKCSTAEKKALIKKLGMECVTYDFLPQVFTNAYVTAWEKFIDDGRSSIKNQVYLVIEEINRGNCAQIFGDIFQLLDRNEKGMSQYTIDVDSDLYEHIESRLKNDDVSDPAGVKAEDRVAEYKVYVGQGKLRLPPNLNIVATMNTSDQSLFPMDSAFKRRFDWEYVSINYDNDVAKNFVIELVDPNDLNKKHYYSWVDFLYVVNDNIGDLTYSEDKQMGEFFVKPDADGFIDKESFRSKVLFYLWDSVYKDERDNTKNNVFEKKTEFEKFQNFFGKGEDSNLRKFMKNLGFDGTKVRYRLKHSNGEMEICDTDELKQVLAIATDDENSVNSAAQARGIEVVKVLQSIQRT